MIQKDYFGRSYRFDCHYYLSIISLLPQVNKIVCVLTAAVYRRQLSEPSRKIMLTENCVTIRVSFKRTLFFGVVFVVVGTLLDQINNL